MLRWVALHVGLEEFGRSIGGFACSLSGGLYSVTKGLVTNYEGGGGYKMGGGGGGQVKFYPYEKGGRKGFSHTEGGTQKVLR